MGTSEIAKFLGVTNQRVDQLARHTSFSQPVAVLGAVRIWSRAWIEARPPAGQAGFDGDACLRNRGDPR